MKKLNIEFVKKQFEKEGYNLLSEKYVSPHSKLNYICPNGHQHNISWTNFQQGQRCFYCVRKDNGKNLRLNLKLIENTLKTENYKLLEIKYNDSRAVIKYICPYNHEHLMRWDHWKSGSRCSKCSNIELSKKYQDNGNPNWNGGTSCEPYCFEWSSKEFKDFIKERDGNRCLNPDCFGNIQRLSVHHIDYNKKNCEPENLITLCTSCNSRANKDREWHKSWYEAIIWARYLKGKGGINHVTFIKRKSQGG
jgi:hypothetical protein